MADREAAHNRKVAASKADNRAEAGSSLATHNQDSLRRSAQG